MWVLPEDKPQAAKHPAETPPQAGAILLLLVLLAQDPMPLSLGEGASQPYDALFSYIKDRARWSRSGAPALSL